MRLKHFLYILDQILVESCLKVCFDLLSNICGWYLKSRKRNRSGILCAITTLIRDFLNFPFRLFQSNDSLNKKIPSISK